MAWTDDSRVVALRHRNQVADVVVGVLDGFRRHQTGRNGAVLTYYGFLTLFPLFLAATTILGFVLDSRPDLHDDIVGSAMSEVPFIGVQLAGNGLSGSWIALIVGLGGAIWGSLKAFVGLQHAYDDVWEIGLDDRSSFVGQRLKALVGLATIGGSQIATVALAGIVAQAGLPRFGQILLVLGGLAINVAVCATMYRYLTSAELDWEVVLPGAVLTGVLYTTLQFAGAALTTRMFQSAETYGDFAGVLALLSWISLHAIVNLFGAELNTVLDRRVNVV